MSKTSYIYAILLALGIMLSGLLSTPSLYADDTLEPASVSPQGPQIVGGKDVEFPNPYKWQVSLVQLDSSGKVDHACGGSVIHEQWILTAAHCVVETDEKGTIIEEFPVIRVVVGAWQLSGINPGTAYFAEEVFEHKDFRTPTLVNDIALIKLSEPIPDAEQYIVPLMTVGLESSLSAPGITAKTTGWGDIGYLESLPNHRTLQEIDMPIVSNEQCQNRYDGPIINSVICAGYSNGLTIDIEKPQGTCNRDSGGPLVVLDRNGGYIQLGVVSFGPLNECATKYTGYTRVSSFINWIEETTGVQIRSGNPDLVVQNITTTENSIAITIKNQGSGPVPQEHDFWVDVYVNPDMPPVRVNEVWDFQGTHGAVWGVESPTVPMQPGDTTTLTIGGQYYHADKSNFPKSLSPGDQIYVQVDSANANNDSYGGVMESDERFGNIYNNIRHFTVGQSLALASQSQEQIPITKIYLPMIMHQPVSDAGSIRASMVSTRDIIEMENVDSNLPIRIR